jgi:hypothetical protein
MLYNLAPLRLRELLELFAKESNRFMDSLRNSEDYNTLNGIRMNLNKLVDEINTRLKIRQPENE